MLNGKRHGRGTKTWPNGDKYDGEWQFDQKDGRGTLSSEAEACYEGEWRSGAKHGKGKVTFACGDEYDGEWQGDRAHGKGVFRKKNGNVYAGSYYQDRCHGFGTLTFTNGDRFEGMWRGGVKSGQGTITWATGRKFTGRFAEDCPVVGELTEDDGKVYRVTYGGGVKFSQGAQPQTRELVCTDAPAGKEHGILAPSLNADATKMRADNGSLAGGGRVQPQGLWRQEGMNQGQLQGRQVQAQAGQGKATSSTWGVLRQGRWFRHQRTGIRLQRFPPWSRGMRRTGTGTHSGQYSPRRHRRQGGYSGKGTRQTHWHRRCRRPLVPPRGGGGPRLCRQCQGLAPPW